MKLTRRGLVATALAVPVAAPSAPEDELKAARENLLRNSEALAKVKVPVETEPAFQFKA